MNATSREPQQSPYHSSGLLRRLARSRATVRAWRKIWYLAFKRYPPGFVGAEWSTDIGDVLRAQGKYAEALRTYELTIRLSRGFHRACESMGHILQGQGRFEEALDCYRKAIIVQSAVDSIMDPDEFNLPSEGKQGPDFLIIGAAKCGTTSLYDYLIRHPRISPAAEKEIHFFDWFYHRGLRWYLGRFPTLSPQSLTGEATPSYIDHPLACRRLHGIYPQIKLILVLRDPADRAISEYHHQVRNRIEQRSLENALRAEMRALERITEEDIVEGRYYNALGYISSGLYVYHLERWLKFFSRDQLLVLGSEDLFRNPSETVNRCFRFLGLADYRLPRYEVLAKGGYAAPDAAFRRSLQDYFRPFNRQLEELLGIDPGWQSGKEQA